MNSDKSQPIKIVLMVVFMISAGLFGWGLLAAVKNIQPPLGFALNQSSFTSAVNSSVTCSATSALVNATDTARSSFIASNDATSTIYLCRSGTCARSTGIPLGATNTIPFKQDDGYFGPYSCIAPSGSSTLNYSYSQ